VTADLGEILYDHYKDSFDKIRDRENQRDRLFIVVAILVAAHVLLLTYAAELPNIVSSFELLGASVEIQRIPIPAILSLSWTLLATVVLRYFQITVHIDKQYDYLHSLEQRLSSALGEPQAISRESAAYLTPRGEILRHVSWVFYLVVFPVAIIGAVIFAALSERADDSIPSVHKIYDFAVGLFIVIVVVVFIAGIWWNRKAS
jgi:hypothetical protein